MNINDFLDYKAMWLIYIVASLFGLIAFYMIVRPLCGRFYIIAEVLSVTLAGIGFANHAAEKNWHVPNIVTAAFRLLENDIDGFWRFVSLTLDNVAVYLFVYAIFFVIRISVKHLWNHYVDKKIAKFFKRDKYDDEEEITLGDIA